MSEAEIRLQSTGFSRADILAIAALHRREIAAGFMSSLAPSLLEMVFGVMATSPACVLIAARDDRDGAICGFVSGTTDAGALYRRFILRKGLRAALVLTPHLLSPRTLRRIVETLRYPSVHRGSPLPDAELLDIAVDRQRAGSGVAQRLFHAFAAALRERGVDAFKVGTGKSLVRAQRFYERLGAKHVATVEVHRGEASFYYLYESGRGAAHPIP